MLLITDSNKNLTIIPEMPDGWHGDMEWDLSDVWFMFETEGAEKRASFIDSIDFCFGNETYTLDIYDAQDLSRGKTLVFAPWNL